MCLTCFTINVWPFSRSMIDAIDTSTYHSCNRAAITSEIWHRNGHQSAVTMLIIAFAFLIWSVARWINKKYSTTFSWNSMANRCFVFPSKAWPTTQLQRPWQHALFRPKDNTFYRYCHPIVWTLKLSAHNLCTTTGKIQRGLSYRSGSRVIRFLCLCNVAKTCFVY